MDSEITAAAFMAVAAAAVTGSRQPIVACGARENRCAGIVTADAHQRARPAAILGYRRAGIGAGARQSYG